MSDPQKDRTSEHSCCQSWSVTLDDIYDRIEDLGVSHQTLAKLTKQNYQYAQHVQRAVGGLDQRVGALSEKHSCQALWRQGLESRLDAIEASQAVVLKELGALGALVQGLTSAVLRINSSEES